MDNPFQSFPHPSQLIHYPQAEHTSDAQNSFPDDHRDMRIRRQPIPHTEPYPKHQRGKSRTSLGVVLVLLISLFFPSPTSGASGISGRTDTPSAYVNPTSGLPRAGTVLRAFDKPEFNWLPGHRGVDLPLDIGADVFSAGGGVVAFTGVVVGTPTVSIDHDDGVRTTYQPVHAHVSTGDRVVAKQRIGSLGHPTTPYPGLQWGARINGEYINPIGLLPAPTIRLKPLTPVDVPAGTHQVAVGS